MCPEDPCALAGRGEGTCSCAPDASLEAEEPAARESSLGWLHSASEEELGGGSATAAEGSSAELNLESFERLRRERTALLYDHCGLKAKFELTLETLRSILQLCADATWADILERTEALAQRGSSGGDDALDNSLPASEAELERERLEENLEAQSAYNARLRGLLQKQQQLLDMTAQQLVSQQEQGRAQGGASAARGRRDAAVQAEAAPAEGQILRERCRKQSDALVQQETLLCEQKQRIAALEAELRQEREALSAGVAEQQQCRAEAERQRAQAERRRAEAERQRAEVRELAEALAQRDDLVERLRAQLQVHEAAERRRHSYHPVGRCAGEDGASEHGSSIGSGQPSARGPPPAADGEAGPAAAGRLRAARPTPARPSVIDGMGKEERDAFLSHFPMALRTERHMRSRLEDRTRRRPTAASPVTAAPASP